VENSEKDYTIWISEGNCFPDVADKYSYPIKNEIETWKKMTDDKRMNACQLPDDVLKSISTLGLIRSFLDVPYPFSLLQGYSSMNPFYASWSVIYAFNSSIELLTRKDAVKSLITYYAAITLDCCEQTEFLYRLRTFECLFATPEILDAMNHDDKVEAVKLLLTRYKQWIDLGYVDTALNINILSVMVCIMYDDMIPYFDQKSLESIKEGSYIKSMVDDIITFAENFISKN